MGDTKDERAFLERLQVMLQRVKDVNLKAAQLEEESDSVAVDLEHLLESAPPSIRSWMSDDGGAPRKRAPKKRSKQPRVLGPDDLAIQRLPGDRARVQMADVRFEVTRRTAVFLSLLAWGQPGPDGFAPWKSRSLLAYAMRLLEHHGADGSLEGLSLDGADLKQDVTSNERQAISMRVLRLRALITKRGGDDWIETSGEGHGYRLLIRSE